MHFKKRLVLVFILLAACKPSRDPCTALKQASISDTCKHEITSTLGGHFEVYPALAGLDCLEKSGKAAESTNLLSLIVHEPESCFDNDDQGEGLKSSLYLMYYYSKSPDAYDFLKKSDALGNQRATYLIATARETPDGDRMTALSKAAFLGNAQAIEDMRIISRSIPNGDSDYWTLASAIQSKMETGKLESPLFGGKDWYLFGKSLSNHIQTQHITVNNKPHRSIECTAWVDYHLHSALGFSGFVKFDQNFRSKATPVDILKAENDSLRESSNYCNYNLIAVSGECKPDARCIIPSEIGQTIEIGDEVIFQYGADSHMALIWSIVGDQIVLLDPMNSYWRIFPSSVAKIDVSSYMGNRTLVTAKISELSPFIVSVFSIDDNPDSNYGGHAP